jgi:photosystem II stability/assembly factor-like uncharacterized protein
MRKLTFFLLFAAFLNLPLWSVMRWKDSFTTENHISAIDAGGIVEPYAKGEIRIRPDFSTLKMERKFGNAGKLYSISFGAVNTAMIVGSSGILKLTTETAPWNWQLKSLPGNSSDIFKKIILSGEVFGILMGKNGSIYEWDGNNWTDKSQASFGADINDFWKEPTSTYGIGVGTGGLLFSWDGANYSEFAGESKTLTTETINSVWGVKEGTTIEAYAVGNNGLFMQYDNLHGWKVLDYFTDENNKNLYDIHLLSTSEGWAVGEDSMILSFNKSNQTWEVSTQAGDFGEDLYCVWATSKNDVWAGGANGLLIHYNGVNWGEVIPTGLLTKGDITDCYFPYSNFGFLISSLGEVFYYDGVNFTKMDSKDNFTMNNLTSVNWVDDNRVIIGDEKGNIWNYNPQNGDISLFTTLSDFPITKIKEVQFNEGYLLANGKLYTYDGLGWSSSALLSFSQVKDFSDIQSQDIVFLGVPSPPFSNSYIYRYQNGALSEMNGSQVSGSMNGKDWVSLDMYYNQMTLEGVALSSTGNIYYYSDNTSQWSSLGALGVGLTGLKKVQVLFHGLAYAGGGNYMYQYKSNSFPPISAMVGFSATSSINDFYMLEEGDGFAISTDTNTELPEFYYSDHGTWNSYVFSDATKYHFFNQMSLKGNQGIIVGDKGGVYTFGYSYNDAITVESKVVLSIPATDPLTHEFYSAVLSADETLNGGSIDYYVSANNGVNWDKIALGIRHYFAVSARGKNLKWKAVLHASADLKATPQLKEVSITAYDDAGEPTQPGKPQHQDDANQGWDNDYTLDFTWEASESDAGIAYYEVWVSENDGDFKKIAQATKNSVGLKIGVERHTYKVKVVPVNTLGIKGETSEVSDVVTVDTVAPTKPSLDKTDVQLDADYLTVKVVTQSYDLHFNYYEIKGGLLGDTFQITGNTKEFTFKLKQNAVQSFYIRGVDEAGNKGAAAEVRVTENSSYLIGPTNAPYHVDETAKTGYDDDSEVDFEWKRNDDYRTIGYWVYFARNHGEYLKYKKVVEPKVTVYARDNDEISIKVRAVNEYGDEGLYSDPSPWIKVDITPPQMELVEPDPKDDIDPENFSGWVFKISEYVDKIAIEKGRVFSLYDEDNGILDLDAKYKDSEDLIYVTPREALKHDKTYKLVINTKLLQDKAGNKVSNIEGTFNFKTKSAGELNVEKFLPYPNPSTDGSSQIFFTLNQDVIDTKLEIYSLSGKKVNVLRDGPIFEGENFFYWDGLDSTGRGVPNGTYFLKLIVKWKDVDGNIQKNEYYTKLMVIK